MNAVRPWSFLAPKGIAPDPAADELCVDRTTGGGGRRARPRRRKALQ